MTDSEVHVDVQHTPDGQPPAAQQEGTCLGKDLHCAGSLQQTPQEEDTLLLLADVALLPPRGDYVSSSCDCEEVRLQRSLQPMQQQLQFLLSQADSLFNRLIIKPENQSLMVPAEEVQRFLYTCQPFFNYVESTTRSTKPLHRDPSCDTYSEKVQLLGFSQQLCDRLEQLVLTLANYRLVCLDEDEPDSISHFCIGRCLIGQMMVTAFRYYKLTPYLSQVDTGIYKRMRWNVKRLPDSAKQLQEDSKEQQEETDGDTEYYFLCCEEILHQQSNAVVKMWSIGLWVQANPDPDTEHIFDWIMCQVPQGPYHRLVALGVDEPSSVTATDHLHKLLLSQPNIRAAQLTKTGRE
ncbi:UPF0575 protein C19orf67 homolog [Halichoeres trimaculatus]|uniref:UPF0575 protein C19orf67 homolog n=1 Tax=Halichoeres trimaculatus TaxID=147232 RepID=UPI003D9E6783